MSDSKPKASKVLARSIKKKKVSKISTIYLQMQESNQMLEEYMKKEAEKEERKKQLHIEILGKWRRLYRQLRKQKVELICYNDKLLRGIGELVYPDDTCIPGNETELVSIKDNILPLDVLTPLDYQYLVATGRIKLAKFVFDPAPYEAVLNKATQQIQKTLSTKYVGTQLIKPEMFDEMFTGGIKTVSELFAKEPTQRLRCEMCFLEPKLDNCLATFMTNLLFGQVLTNVAQIGRAHV